MSFDKGYLDEFEKENGYSFFDMLNDPEIREKHKMKQNKIQDYDDNDFLEEFQDKQG